MILLYSLPDDPMNAIKRISMCVSRSRSRSQTVIRYKLLFLFSEYVDTEESQFLHVQPSSTASRRCTCSITTYQSQYITSVLIFYFIHFINPWTQYHIWHSIISLWTDEKTSSLVISIFSSTLSSIVIRRVYCNTLFYSRNLWNRSRMLFQMWILRTYLL